MRVEFKNGKVYDVDPKSYYEHVFHRGHHKIGIEQLKEIDQTAEGKEIWLGMGEINRGCEKLHPIYNPI